VCADGRCKVALTATAGYKVKAPSGEKVFAQKVDISIEGAPEQAVDTVVRSELIGKLKTLLGASTEAMNKADFSK
jgi:hypothetical protein